MKISCWDCKHAIGTTETFHEYLDDGSGRYQIGINYGVACSKCLKEHSKECKKAFEERGEK